MILLQPQLEALVKELAKYEYQPDHPLHQVHHLARIELRQARSNIRRDFAKEAREAEERQRLRRFTNAQPARGVKAPRKQAPKLRSVAPDMEADELLRELGLT